jgi:ribonuclease T1
MSKMSEMSPSQFLKALGAPVLRNVRQAATLVLLALLVLLGTNLVQAKEATPASISTIALNELPAQGQAVMKLIYQGGPFRYDKDGTVFGNREKLLPLHQRGYYREYTVKTPGERSRGARRIVCGGLQPTAPNACYYTADHYASFRQIVQPGK